MIIGVLLLLSAVSLADLSFIAGDWRGTMGATAIEETWSQPLGDAMIGMFRMVRGGKTGLTEFMAIEQRDDGPVLVLRHFRPGLIASEDKDAPLVFTLEKLEPNRAVFLLKAVGTRLEYHRVSPEQLTITLEKTSGGKATRTPFVYKLVRAVP